MKDLYHVCLCLPDGVHFDSLDDARAAAEALAKDHPGEPAFVLQAVGRAITAASPVTWEEINHPPVKPLTPFEAGQAAFNAKRPGNANPFEDGSEDRRFWLAGWLAAQDATYRPVEDVPA